MDATTRLAEIKTEIEVINSELSGIRKQIKELSKKEWALVSQIIDLTKEQQSYLEA